MPVTKVQSSTCLTPGSWLAAGPDFVNPKLSSRRSSSVNVPTEVKKRRKKARLSQAEVAAEIGRSQFWVSLVERGQTVVDKNAFQWIIIAIDRAAERKTAI